MNEVSIESVSMKDWQRTLKSASIPALEAWEFVQLRPDIAAIAMERTYRSVENIKYCSFDSEDVTDLADAQRTKRKYELYGANAFLSRRC